MPPRYAYWTIIAGGLPTAFRAAEREELEPTFQRLRDKHPDAEMKWFARGKLWESQEAAQAGPARREPGGRDARSGPERDRDPRGRDWRPGGEHRDPRQPYQDAKKARNQRWREEKFANRQRGADRDERPHGDALRPRDQGKPFQDDDRRSERPRPHGDKLQAGAPKREGVRGDGGKPFGDRERKPLDRDRKPAPTGERKPYDRDRKPFDRDRRPAQAGDR